MILVADSGSSKTDWLLYQDNQELKQFRTSGLNPYFLNEKEIVKILYDQAQDLIAYAPEIKEIYFFGAGCSSPDRHEVVSNALSVFFTKSYISIDIDLLGYAYATCGHHKGLCCVLATGSNISFFDGDNIHDGQHGLGFVLGDEGASTWFGKELITDFLYGNMPTDIYKIFDATFKLTKDQVIKNVYQKPDPNTYLASFSKFLDHIRGSEYGAELLNSGFIQFIDSNIKSFPEYHNFKCHFVGSIAFNFAEELTALCKKNEISVGKIILEPIHDLMTFILSGGLEKAY